MLQLIRKFFDTSDKDVKAIMPIVEKINALEPVISELSDDDLRAKGPYFRERVKNGEALDALLPEVFACVREASKRILGMRQFDVQLVGGVVLHQGRISEMKTGEGKTLVAVAPLVLNALSGRGTHLVTVNDYLARRDAVWMGPIYHFFGLSLGVIQGQSVDSDELGGSYVYEPGYPNEDPRYANLRPATRREAYLCDITYGTNHEFGFDYLRDNMAFDKDDLVMAELNYAIIDEVDSILVDEARTPHIISGPSGEDVSLYKQVDQLVRQLQPEIHWTCDKKNHSASLTEEGMDKVEELWGIDNIASDPKLFHYVNASVKAYALFDRDVDYVVRANEVVIVDENTGRMMFGRRFSDGLHQALEAKEGVPVQRESQTVAVITFQNLFRLYEKLAGMTGTAKTEEDEFRKIYGLDVVTIPTHRDMIRVDQDDVVYKTAEGKWRGIAREILRVHSRQQPMLVGTRSIEMSEAVSERLTADGLQRLLLTERLHWIVTESKSASKSLKKSILDVIEGNLMEIQMETLKQLCREAGISSDPLAAEQREWFFKEYNLGPECIEHFDDSIQHGIPHNVLNAKYHEREALIISEAGRKGAITIATNMAGRGVDILLGGRVSDAVLERARAEEEQEDPESVAALYAETYASFRRGGKERAAPPLPLDDQERKGLAEEVRALGGLYILGTERHESRRIDNQLRGRAGRQGDPGESRFFVSLEDQLWKIFNAKMLENPMLKGWPDLDEVKAGFLTNMILKTQERIENHFFEARKHVLEYDDVLNSQREHIYGMRREALLGADVTEEILKGMEEVVAEEVSGAFTFDESGNQVLDYDHLYENLNQIFPLVDYATPDDLRQRQGQALIEYVTDQAHEAYETKREKVGDEVMIALQQKVMLQAVNDRWMEHLQMIDYIREGIGLRGYGQIDPLIAYKRETYDLFQSTLRQIRDQMVRLTFRANIRVEQEEAARPDGVERMMQLIEETPQPADGAPREWPANVDAKRVSRNDTCPCGSGKKFKSCHYPILRAQGVI
ncbi:MAG: preprotein translocase subunit SecA [Armatimonadetes bacterium]|nr:preprotein translocase subunit SecA [Armatimonadota bacterium]